MQTAFRRRNGDCLVLISGRITIDCSSELRILLMRAIEMPEYESLTVDFYEVAYVDMSGLAVLLEVLRTARKLKKSLRLSGLRGRSRYLLEATRLLHFFEEVDRNVPQ
jgi:anti-anti-sigma factor